MFNKEADEMKAWQPYKLAFCPITFYVYGTLQLNEDGKVFQESCAIVDTILLMTLGR